MDWLPVRLVLCLSSTFWTLAPHDHVTCCQARGLSGHISPCGECVFLNLEDPVPLEAEEDYLLFSWSDTKWAHLVHYKEIFDSELELLTPLWQAVLGLYRSVMVHAAQQLLITAQQLITVVGP